MSFDSRLLTGVSVLTAIVENGSLVKAANAMGITASGISRALSRLEARVGARLLHRTTRSVKLSDEGRRFYERVKPSLVAIEEAAVDVSGTTGVVRGLLRVSVAPLVAQRVLAGKLGGFLARHPELSLDLITHEKLGDFVSDRIDVAISFGEPARSSLVARKLVDTRVLTCAAPDYIKRHGRPKHPDDLVRHTCIHFRDPLTGQEFGNWEFHKGRKVVVIKTTSRLMVSDAETMFAECAAGSGIAQVNENAVRELLGRKKLIELFPEWNGETYPLYALYPSRHHQPAKVRAFIDFMIEILSAR